MCSERRRQRPQRYSVKDFVEAVSENEAGFDSDDDIVGEVVYDDEYLRKRKERRTTPSSSSEGDEEYNWDEENPEEVEEEEEEEEEEDDDDNLSTSEESGGRRRFRTLRAGRTRRETKLRSVGELQSGSGLRRSKRSTRNHINYQQYEMSDSENETMKPDKSSNFVLEDEQHSDDESGDNNEELSMDDGLDSEEKTDKQEMDVDQPTAEEENLDMNDDKKETDPPEESNTNSGGNQDFGKRRFLDLNELAPGSGFDDGPSLMRDDDLGDF